MDSYLHHTINRKKIFIYLKKGRFLLLLLCVLSFWTRLDQHSFHSTVSVLKPVRGIMEIVLNLSLIFFIAIFALVLIPVIFKNGRFGVFWSLLLLIILGAVAGELGVLVWYDYHQIISIHSMFSLIVWLFKKYILILLSVAGLLFFVEQIEEIQLLKDIRRFALIRKSSREKMMGTRTELPFMINQLRNVRNALDINPDQGRASLLDFADILRYKLYEYDNPSVPISSELNILRKLISTTISQVENPKIVLQIEEPISQLQIFKSSIINTLLPIISNHSRIDGTIEIVILVEEQLHIFIEMSALAEDVTQLLIDLIQEQTEIYGYLPIEIIKENYKTNVNLCHQTIL